MTYDETPVPPAVSAWSEIRSYMPSIENGARVLRSFEDRFRKILAPSTAETYAEHAANLEQLAHWLKASNGEIAGLPRAKEPDVPFPEFERVVESRPAKAARGLRELEEQAPRTKRRQTNTVAEVISQTSTHTTRRCVGCRNPFTHPRQHGRAPAYCETCRPRRP